MMHTGSPHEVSGLLSELQSKGITLWEANGELRFRAPRESLTAEIKASLKENKADLISLIKGPTFELGEHSDEVPFLHHYRIFGDLMLSNQFDASFSNATHWFAEVDADRFVDEMFARASTRIADFHRILSAQVDTGPDGAVFRLGNPIAPEFHHLPDVEIGKHETWGPLCGLIWRSFDARHEPLFRPIAARIADGKVLMGFVLHHIIGDATAIGTLSLDLLRFYDLQHFKVDCRIGFSGLDYGDYIRGLNAWVRSPAFEHRMRYWRALLSEAHSHSLTGGAPQKSNSTSSVAELHFAFGNGWSQRVYEKARELRTTPYFVLMAANAMLVARRSGQSLVALLAMHHGREDQRFGGTIGSFQNQIPLCVAVRPGDQLATVADRCSRAFGSAVSNGVPYHYLKNAAPQFGGQRRYAEFNCSVSGANALAKMGDGDTVEVDGVKRKVLRTHHFPHRLKLSSSISQYPAYKLNFRNLGSDIVGSVCYLEEEYIEPQVNEFLREFEQLFETNTTNLLED